MKQKTRLPFMLALLALCMGAVVLMHPTSTQAASLSTARMWTKGHAQPDVAPGNLLYNGGPVMTGTTKVYVIFWEPKGSVVSRTYNKLILRYFNDVGNTGLYENNEQYTDTTGKAPQNSVLAASWVDKAPYPTTPDLADVGVRNEVTHAMAVNGWNQRAPTSSSSSPPWANSFATPLVAAHQGVVASVHITLPLVPLVMPMQSMVPCPMRATIYRIVMVSVIAPTVTPMPMP